MASFFLSYPPAAYFTGVKSHSADDWYDYSFFPGGQTWSGAS